jgi:hypothetical protein
MQRAQAWTRRLFDYPFLPISNSCGCTVGIGRSTTAGKFATVLLSLDANPRCSLAGSDIGKGLMGCNQCGSHDEAKLSHVARMKKG